MTRISREQFLNEATHGDIDLAINVKDAATLEKLKKAGISEAELKKIAGSDGFIKGKAEYTKLFKAVDTFDKDGKYDSIETRDDKNVPTPSGQVYDALKSELDLKRNQASTKGIIHLGMRVPSTLEVAALEKANSTQNGGVVSIKGYESNGEIKYNGTTYDLTKEKGLNDFRDSLTKNGPNKMTMGQAQKFVDTLKHSDINPTTRDELAQLGLAMHDAGTGKIPTNRLVISGHGLPGGLIWGDDGQGFTVGNVKDLVKVFPEGAKKIEHVAVAACFCAGRKTFEDLREGFPNLKSAVAYKEFSPKAEKGAPADLKQWEKWTEGDDPSVVDPKFHKSATWNIVDGTQGFKTPKLKTAEDNAKKMEHAYEAYKSKGKDPSKGPDDAELREYYVRLADLVRHPDISSKRKTEVEARIQDVLRLRAPELFTKKT